MQNHSGTARYHTAGTGGKAECFSGDGKQPDKECTLSGYIALDAGGNRYLTEDGHAFLSPFKVDGALFIAAGFGSRFVPLTYEMPKGLLEVQGERMIERQIRQLKEAGISDITIVVGYLKEKFEYLIDKYDVTLLYNPEYACKNTLATLYHARDVLKGRNMYLLSSDNWMRENMFHTYEWGPWYSCVHIPGETSEWCLSYNKRGLITDVTIGGRDAWIMYGPAFFQGIFCRLSSCPGRILSSAGNRSFLLGAGLHGLSQRQRPKTSVPAPGTHCPCSFPKPPAGQSGLRI